MGKRGKRIAVEVDALDRISSLPINVINQILDLLPIRVVAKTSVLSRKWKYIWASHPNIKIDGNSFIIKKKKKGLPQNDFTNIINKILLQHIGPVLKFSLEFPLPTATGPNASDIYFVDHWLRYVSQKGIKELTLKCCSKEELYMLPYHVYSATDLVTLNLHNCVFNLTTEHAEFRKLTTLNLCDITFRSDKETSTINTPQLTHLMFSFCNDVCEFKICAPKLKTLIIEESDDVDFIGYEMCEITTLGILGSCALKETSLKKLLKSWRSLSCFYVYGMSFEFFTADTRLDTLPITTSCLTRLVLKGINWGNLHQISCILHLIRSSTTLSRLEIETELIYEETTVDDMSDYLDAAHKMNRTVNCLEVVVFGPYYFDQGEELFIKLLLSCSPRLKKIFIHEVKYLDPSIKIDILKKLTRLPRASAEAEIIFEQNTEVAKFSDISPIYDGLL